MTSVAALLHLLCFGAITFFGPNLTISCNSVYLRHAGASCLWDPVHNVIPPTGGGISVGQAPNPWKLLPEDGTPSLVPTSLEDVTRLLNGLSVEQQYGTGVATMAYTAQRAKLAEGVDKQEWTQLFIKSFKYVYGDIMGDPDKAIGLC